MILGLLWAANLIVTLVQRWIELLRSLRVAIGVPAPAAGPDWWVLGGIGVLAVTACALIAWAWAVYRSAWTRRLGIAWPAGYRTEHARMLRLRGVASDQM